MKLIPVSTWRDAALRLATYRVPAAKVEDAIAIFKRRFPTVEPHTCYWYAETDKINVYCFLWRE